MTDFLLKTFIKDYKNTKNIKVRENYGKLAGIIGILSNLLLFAVKISIGIFTASLATVVDAVNNLMDSASSIITLIGFRLSGKPADREHPYGHARTEYITTLFISQIIVFVGVEFLRTSINKILKPAPTNMTPIALAILLISIIVKFWQSNFNKKLGTQIGSTALIATAKDSRNDCYITLGILFGAIIEYFFALKIDGIVGGIIAIYIIVSGVMLVLETVGSLLGHAPSKELVEKIEQKICSYDGVYGFHDLAVHDYGPGKLLASVHVEVHADVDILVSHDLIDCIENDFKKDMGIEVVIHMDPVQTDKETIVLGKEILELVKALDNGFSIHDFRIVKGKTHTNLIFDLVVPYSLAKKETDEYIKAKISKLIDEKYTNFFAVIRIDHNYILDGNETSLESG